MLICYCDLCGLPIKGNKYMLTTEKFFENPPTYEWEKQYPITIKHNEVCESCKIIIDEIFNLRFKELNKLAQEIHRLFSLDSKLDKEKKHDEKEEENYPPV
jgi:hypothetical protein